MKKDNFWNIVCIVCLSIFLSGCQITNRSNSYRHQQIGTNYIQENEIDKALAEYNKAVEADPTDYLAYYNRGVVYLKYKFKLKEAEEDIDKALELNPDYAKSHVIKGDIYRVKGELDKAMKEYDVAVKLEPDNWCFYHAKSVLYNQLKDYSSSLREMNKAIEIEPSSQNYFRRGWTYYKMKKYDLAMEDCDKALKIDKSNKSDYCFIVGLIQYDKGEYDAALENLEKSGTSAYDIQYYLGLVYQKKMEYEKARDSFKRYIENDKNPFLYNQSSDLINDAKKRLIDIEEHLKKNEQK